MRFKIRKSFKEEIEVEIPVSMTSYELKEFNIQQALGTLPKWTMYLKMWIPNRNITETFTATTTAPTKSFAERQIRALVSVQFPRYNITSFEFEKPTFPYI